MTGTGNLVQYTPSRFEYAVVLAKMAHRSLAALLVETVERQTLN